MGGRGRYDPVVVAAMVSIVHEGRILMVQEGKASARDQWNFPSGRPGGSTAKGFSTLRRGCREEMTVRLRSTIGVYMFLRASRDQGVRFHCLGDGHGGT